MSDSRVEFWAGVIAGGVIGLAAGLLLAPSPGEVTRAQLRRRLEETSEKTLGGAREIGGKVLHGAEEIGGKVLDRAQDLVSKVKEQVRERIPGLGSSEAAAHSEGPAS